MNKKNPSNRQEKSDVRIGFNPFTGPIEDRFLQDRNNAQSLAAQDARMLPGNIGGWGGETKEINTSRLDTRSLLESLNIRKKLDYALTVHDTDLLNLNPSRTEDAMIAAIDGEIEPDSNDGFLPFSYNLLQEVDPSDTRRKITDIYTGGSKQIISSPEPISSGRTRDKHKNTHGKRQFNAKKLSKKRRHER